MAPEVEAPREPPPEPEPADVAAVQQHRLTVEEVQRYTEAARAVHQAVQTDPELRRVEAEIQERFERAHTIEETQRIMRDYPQLRRAIEQAGISTENYMLTGAALFGAYNYVLMREQGIPDPFRPEYLTDQHIAFVQENREEIDQLVARLMEAYTEEDF